MIAPTTLAVAAIRSAEKTYGSDVGTRSFQSTVQRLGRVGAHQLERARVGRLQPAQRVDRDREEGQVGGDHRDRAPALHAAGSFGLTQTTTIGAIARIGIVWLATMYGRKPRCSEPRVDEHDAEREADDGADREAGRPPPSR